MRIDELIKTVQIKIPETDMVVDIKTELSWFEQLECAKIEDEIERGKYLVLKLVVNWNIEDTVGKPLPITKDTIERMPTDVIIPITKEIIKIAGDNIQKKKS